MKGLALRIFLILGVIITGTMVYFTTKLQNIQKVSEICPPQMQLQQPSIKFFFHPIIQTFFMFLGQFLCLIYIFFWKRINPKKYHSRQDFAKFAGKYKARIWVLFFPTAMDFLASMVRFFAINLVKGSTYAFLKSGVIVTTALFSYKYTKIPLKKHQKSGCLIVFIGLLIVAASNLIGQESEATINAPGIWYVALGIGLLLISDVFEGIHLSYEQRLFQKYYIQPFEMVGYEGIFGMLLTIGLIAITNYIPCPFPMRGCVCSQGKMYIEHVSQFFYSLENQTQLIILIIALVVCVSLFNIFGTYTTQKVNALARSIVDSSRSVLITLVGFIVTVTAGQNSDQYKFQNLQIAAVIVKVLGIILIIFGMLLYNQFIHIKHLSESKLKNRDSLLQSDILL